MGPEHQYHLCVVIFVEYVWSETGILVLNYFFVSDEFSKKLTFLTPSPPSPPAL